MAGINFYNYKSKQYKTNLISISFIDKLEKEHATENALLLNVLTRGCKRYKKSTEIQTALEGMYGATMTTSISKRGDAQSLEIVFSYPANEFVGDDVTSRIVQLICEVLFKPYIENGAFNLDYVEQEKKNLISRIERRKDDKRIYSINRCFDKVFDGTNAGICEYGYIEDVEKITPESLFNRYQQLVDSSQMCLFLCGNFDRETRTRVNDRIEEYWGSCLSEGVNYQTNQLSEKSEEYIGEVFMPTDLTKVSEYDEPMDVQQGKLAVAFVSGIDLHTENGVALRVANSIFGGGMHSKLFNVIREQKSLAYYASSMMEPYKSVIIASSGIEFSNKQLVVDLMIQQLDAIKNGEISEYEFDSAKKALMNTYKSMLDSSYSMASFELGRTIMDSPYTIPELIKAVSEVTMENVIKVSKQIVPHTVYFITGKEDK